MDCSQISQQTTAILSLISGYGYSLTVSTPPTIISENPVSLSMVCYILDALSCLSGPQQT